MTTAPVVELHFNPTGLRPSDLSTAGAFLGSPADAIEAALAVARAAMVDQMRREIRGLAEPTHDQIVRIADLAWQLVAWRFRKVSAPIMADAYIHAYRNAQAGDVPMSMIYDLAEKHAEKVGDYFHTSSRDALLEGFNLSVNRRIPAKAAADRVLDAYGLTPRGMRTYVGASQFQTPVSDVMPRSIKAKARAYIDKAFTSRTRKLAKQEEHNIDEQAKQFAWMWLQSKGRLNEHAEKLWITAKDERVCKVCGPLHNKRVKVNERFVTAQGEFWTPGLHPNCRCVIRLLEHTFKKDLYGTALADFNQEHPRGQGGRFGTKTQERPKYSAVTRKPDTELARAFQEIVAGLQTAHPTGRAASSRAVIDMRTPKPAVQPVTATRAPITGTRARPVGTTRKPVVGTRAESKATIKVKTAQPATKVKPKVIPRTAATVRTNPATQPESKVDTSAVTTTRGAAAPKAPPKTLNWAVVRSDMFDPEKTEIELTDAHAYENLSEAYADAAAAIESAKQDYKHRLKERPRFSYGTEGQRYEVTPRQVDELVDRFAQREAISHPKGTEAVETKTTAKPMKVLALDFEGRALKDERGEKVYTYFTQEHLAGQLRIDPSDFDYKIVGGPKTSTGPYVPPIPHPSIEEAAMMRESVELEPGELGGSQSKVFEGRFRTKFGGYHREHGKDITIEAIELEPTDKPNKPIGRPKKRD